MEGEGEGERERERELGEGKESKKGWYKNMKLLSIDLPSHSLSHTYTHTKQSTHLHPRLP